MKKVFLISIISALIISSCCNKKCDNSQQVNEDSIKQEIQKTEEDIQKIDKTSKELDTASVKLDEALKEIQ